MPLLWSAAVNPIKNPLLVAGVGEWVSSSDPSAVLATYALGSCVGLAAYDPTARAGGILHFMLPDSLLNPARARLLPGTFCDTGIPGMLAELESLGARRGRLVVHLAGAAAVLDKGDFFDIGRRNVLAARRKLWELGLIVEDEDTGGEISRTLKLGLAQGRVTVRDSFGERELGSRATRR
jgi:chemotaxis protein CheD